MSRFLRLSILTLVALWLPVTLHCRLEAAGFYEMDECCVAEQASDECSDDACPTVEDALYKESTQVLKVIAPDLSTCVVCLELPPPCSLLCSLSPDRQTPPPEL